MESDEEFIDGRRTKVEVNARLASGATARVSNVKFKTAGAYDEEDVDGGKAINWRRCESCYTEFEDDELLREHMRKFHPKLFNALVKDTGLVSPANSVESLNLDPDQHSIKFQPIEEQNLSFDPRREYRYYDEMVASACTGLAGYMDANACAIACLHAAHVLLSTSNLYIDQSIVDNIVEESRTRSRDQASSPSMPWIFDPLKSGSFESFPTLDLIPLARCEEELTEKDDHSEKSTARVMTTMQSVAVPNLGSRGVCAILNCGLETVLLFGHRGERPFILFDPGARNELGIIHRSAAFMSFSSPLNLQTVLDRIFPTIHSTRLTTSRHIKNANANLLRFQLLRMKNHNMLTAGNSPFSVPDNLSPIDTEATSKIESPPNSEFRSPGIGSPFGRPFMSAMQSPMATWDQEIPISKVEQLKKDQAWDDCLLTRAFNRLVANSNCLELTLSHTEPRFDFTTVRSLVDALWSLTPVREYILGFQLRDGPGSLMGSFQAIFFAMEQQLGIESMAFALQSLIRGLHIAAPLSFQESDIGMVVDNFLRETLIRHLAADGATRRSFHQGQAVTKICVSDLFSIQTLQENLRLGTETEFEHFVHYVPGYHFLSNQNTSSTEANLKNLLPLALNYTKTFSNRNSLTLSLPVVATGGTSSGIDPVREAVARAKAAWVSRMPVCDVRGEQPICRPFFFMARSKSPVSLRSGSHRRIFVTASNSSITDLVGMNLPPNLAKDLSHKDFECYIASGPLREFLLAWLVVLLRGMDGQTFYEQQTKSISDSLWNLLVDLILALQLKLKKGLQHKWDCGDSFRRIPAKYISTGVDLKTSTAIFEHSVSTTTYSGRGNAEHLILDFLHELSCKECSSSSSKVELERIVTKGGFSEKHHALYRKERLLLDQVLSEFTQKLKNVVQLQPFEYVRQRLLEEEESASLGGVNQGREMNGSSRSHLRYSLLHKPMLYVLYFDWSRGRTGTYTKSHFAGGDCAQYLRTPYGAEIKQLLSRIKGDLNLNEVFDESPLCEARVQANANRNQGFWLMAKNLFDMSTEPALFFESLRRTTQIVSSSALHLPPIPPRLQEELFSSMEDAYELFSSDPDWFPMLQDAMTQFKQELQYFFGVVNSKIAMYSLCTIITVRNTSKGDQQYRVYSKNLSQFDSTIDDWFDLSQKTNGDKLVPLSWRTLADSLAESRSAPVLCFYKRQASSKPGLNLVGNEEKMSEIQQIEKTFGNFVPKAYVQRMNHNNQPNIQTKPQMPSTRNDPKQVTESSRLRNGSKSTTAENEGGAFDCGFQ